MSPTLTNAVAAFRSGQLDRARTLALVAAAEREAAPLANHLIGLIDCRRGDLASGVEHLRRAAEAEPANATFRIMLVRALIDSGDAAEALALAGRRPNAAPESLQLWIVRGEAATAAGDHDAAAEAWGTIVAQGPDDWRAWSNFGNALAALKRWSEAADALARAAMLNPQETAIRGNLAAAQAEAQRFGEAADTLALLLDEQPEDARLRLFLAEVLTQGGRPEQALAELDKVAELATNSGGLLALATKDDAGGPDAASVRKIARLLERTNRVDALRSLIDEAEELGVAREKMGVPAAAIAFRNGDSKEAKRLLLADDPEREPGPWHRLMSKVEDALGHTAQAFAEAAAMNRATADYETWRERGLAYRTRVRRLAELATADWAATLPTAPPPDRRSPAFLVGFPRSGTTLLDTFLMGHPDACVLEEVPLLGAAERVLGDIAELPRRTVDEIEQGRAAYFAELDRHVEPGFGGLVVDKLPLNIIGLPFIHSLFPDARIIFAQRHPVDAVLSGFMQNFVMNDAMACFLDIEDAADLYDATMSAFTRQRAALSVRVHSLVYEELIVDTERTLRPLIDFLDLDWRDELLDHQKTARERGAILTPSYDQVVKPLTAAPSGRWRRYEEQLAPVLPVLLPWADRLGYGGRPESA